MSDNNNTNVCLQIIEEYKSLRAELLINIEHHRKGYAVWLAIVIPILTFAISQEQPWVCLLAWLLTFYAWRVERNINATIMKIGRYIAIFIEPEIEGIRWETTIAKADKMVRHTFLSLHKSFIIRLFGKLSNPYSVISLFSIVIGISLFYVKSFSKQPKWFLLIIIFFVSIIHSVIANSALKRSWATEREYWNKEFSHLRNEQEKFKKYVKAC